MQDGLVLVDVRDERPEAFGVLEDLLLARALVLQLDAQAARSLQVRGLAEALLDDVVVDLDGREDVLVGRPGHGRPRAVRVAGDLQVPGLHAARELHLVDLAVLVHRDVQARRERVHAGHADAVQAAGDLVRLVVELAARVELRQHDLDRRNALGRVDADGDPAPIVLDRHGAVGAQDDAALRRVAGERLVDRVVDHLPDEVVHAACVRVADVHRRPDPHRLEAFEDGDGVCAVRRCRAFRSAGVRASIRIGGLVQIAHERRFSLKFSLRIVAPSRSASARGRRSSEAKPRSSARRAVLSTSMRSSPRRKDTARARAAIVSPTASSHAAKAGAARRPAASVGRVRALRGRSGRFPAGTAAGAHRASFGTCSFGQASRVMGMTM